MRDVKDSPRAHVRIGYDGRVHKTYRGRMAEERYHTEKNLLRFLERRGCDFVPRVLECHDEELLLVMGLVALPRSPWKLTPDMKLTHHRSADEPNRLDGVNHVREVLRVLPSLCKDT